MSEEAARQIDRADLALRVAEAPQLAQGLASDPKIVGLVLPLLLPEPVDAAGPVGATAAASPAHEPFSLSAVAHELSWQSAMAELLAMVRLEGAAAVDSAAAKAASANVYELLLASATAEDSAPVAATEPQQAVEGQPEQHRSVATTPDFVDHAFGNIGVSVLSLQNKDLFGFELGKDAPSAQTADLDGAARQVIDYDLFGAEGAQGISSLSKAGNPIVVGSVGGEPIDPGDGEDDPGTASIGNGASLPSGGNYLPGMVKLMQGQQNVTMDLDAVLARADASHSLLVRGDGDDKLNLVGDWFLVSEDPAKSVSVYAHNESSAMVTAEQVEVILA
ncbi:MAG TPA: hypothetical protein VJL84_08660 [Kiloniellales bacterium]|nr:hypothetical protein [Kiloniellales bacterium]